MKKGCVELNVDHPTDPCFPDYHFTLSDPQFSYLGYRSDSPQRFKSLEFNHRVSDLFGLPFKKNGRVGKVFNSMELELFSPVDNRIRLGDFCKYG